MSYNIKHSEVYEFFRCISVMKKIIMIGPRGGFISGCMDVLTSGMTFFYVEKIHLTVWSVKGVLNLGIRFEPSDTATTIFFKGPSSFLQARNHLEGSTISDSVDLPLLYLETVWQNYEEQRGEP